MGLELTLIFSFSKYLLKTHEVLDILLNTGNSEENKTFSLPSWSLQFNTQGSNVELQQHRVAIAKTVVHS